MNASLPPGSRGPECGSAQKLFAELALLLDGIETCPVTGIHTGPSVRNVMWLQRMLGLPQTGELDPGLLHCLAALRRLAFRCTGTDIRRTS